MYISKESTDRAVTSWHPIHTTPSENLWAIPSRTFDEDDMIVESPSTIRSVGSFSNSETPRTQTENNNGAEIEQRDDQETKKRQVLGDRSNTAPVLRLRRSRFT